MIKGYDFEVKTNTGNYLRLKSAGDKAKIRLVSTPIHFMEEYEGKFNDRFAWIVIDRADGEIKAFKGGVMIYAKIKEYAIDDDWGEPKEYDLTITRTEEKGNYYTVIASPKKTKITAEELKKIKETDLDLEKMFKTEDKGTKTFGEGGATEQKEDKEALEQAVDEMEV